MFCCTLTGRRSRRRLIWMLLGIVFVTSLYLTLQPIARMHFDMKDGGNKQRGRFMKLEHQNMSIVEEGGQEQACVLPKLDLWHPGLKSYFTDPEPLKCKDGGEDWVYTENGTFYVSNSAKNEHSNVWCDITPITLEEDSRIVPGTPIKPFSDGSELVTDFFLARCISATGSVYKNLHSGIAKIKNIQQRTALSKASVSESSLGMNILMFGFDSVSRMTWMRNLPKAHDYLVKVLGGVVLEGYNILGDGTPQALLPILTGKTEEELPEARRGFPKATTVDGHPWIWKDLAKLGYVTQWGEDGASFGTFNFRMRGFDEQPVDHYMRPFYMMAEKTFYNQNQPYCLGSVPRHRNMLNWVKQFFQVYPDTPKFSFLFHSEFSHDGYSKLRLADDDVKEFLEYMHDSGHLNNTLLILMSDHGARFQKVRETEQGKYEERMPYFSFRFPHWFQNQYPKAMANLKLNAQRLTTPFDVHATFEDLINFSGANQDDKRQRGMSLLREIPLDRSCADAQIAPHWCTCLEWVETSLDDRHVIASAEAVVDKINTLVGDNNDKCEELSLHDIMSAVKYYPNERLLKFKKSSDVHGRIPDFTDRMNAQEEMYQVTIETKPGGGRFEATVKHVLNPKVKPQYVVNLREISRINKYGKAPHCVMEQLPHLRPYCYCKIQPSKPPRTTKKSPKKKALYA